VPGPKQGRLEVLHETPSGVPTWGTVCSDGFNSRAARVACWQLGYKNGGAVTALAQTADASAPIWLDDLSCGGAESKLQDCMYYQYWGMSDCPLDHSRDVAILCY
jgi:hypothetical protein